ncbi:MAG: RAMP superfamily CRISPR-associated protein, partial [Cyanobacteria bacterium P01_H01_bin.15]
MTVGTLKIKTKANKKGNLKKSFEFEYFDEQRKYFKLPYDKIVEEQKALALIAKIDAISAPGTTTLDIEFEVVDDRVLKLRELGQPWDRAEAQETNRSTGGPQSRPDETFHNPYNFVPALPREQITGELGDGHPVGHGRYHLERWTGRIGVQLKVMTPLLIPDAAEMSEDMATNHKTFPVRVGSDGKPYLAATSIKGMLRSAYEAVTNSRLSVFVDHQARLAYRMPAREGTTAKPARVIERANGSLWLRILEDSSCVGGSAKLLRYEQRGQSPDKGERGAATPYAGTEDLPEHGDCVRVRLEQGKVSHIEKWSEEQALGNGWRLG